MSHYIVFLGLGAMGQRMAVRLLDAGHTLSIWNRSAGPEVALQKRGARVAASPREAASAASVVFSMVRDDAASRHVWLDPAQGAMHGLAADAVAVECSTLTPAWVRELAAALPVDLVDAPVAGSRPQADAGQLIFLAGGRPEALARLTPLLLTLGSAVHPVGSAGQGSALKLAVNALFAAQVAMMAEQLTVLARQGVDLPHALEALKSLPVTSPAAAGAARAMLVRDFAPQFPIDLVVKDLGYARQAGGGAMPLTTAVADRFQAAQAAGWGEAHLTAVCRLNDIGR